MTPSTPEARRLALLTLFSVSFDRGDGDPAVRLSRPDLWRFVAPRLASRGIGRNAFTAALRDLTEAYTAILTDGGTAHGGRPVLAVVDPLRDAGSPALWRAALRAEGFSGDLAEVLADLAIPSRAIGVRRGLAPDAVVLGDGRVRCNALRAEAAEDLRMDLVDDEGRLECAGCKRLLDADDDFSDDGLRRHRCRDCERERARRRRGSAIPPGAPRQRKGRGGRHLRSARPAAARASSTPDLSEAELDEAELDALDAADMAAERAQRIAAETEQAARAVPAWRERRHAVRRSAILRSVEAHNESAREAMDATLDRASRAAETTKGPAAARAYVAHQQLLPYLDGCELEHRTAVRHQRPYDARAFPLDGLPEYVAPDVADLLP